MLLGFMKQFGPKIVDGTKVLTNRVKRKDGKVPAYPGDILYMYTGLRTLQCKRIFEKGKEKVCTGVWEIRFTPWGLDYVRVESNFLIDVLCWRADYVDWERHPVDILERLAIMDGWDNFSEMADFFKPHYNEHMNLIYWGKGGETCK